MRKLNRNLSAFFYRVLYLENSYITEDPLKQILYNKQLGVSKYERCSWNIIIICYLMNQESESSMSVI